MNKIPLSGFCLLLKSRHKHLFRIMRITYMLLFAAIFCLHAENAISQKITLQGEMDYPINSQSGWIIATLIKEFTREAILVIEAVEHMRQVLIVVLVCLQS